MSNDVVWSSYNLIRLVACNFTEVIIYIQDIPFLIRFTNYYPVLNSILSLHNGIVYILS